MANGSAAAFAFERLPQICSETLGFLPRRKNNVETLSPD
jgi:hypothetical protein